MKRFLLVQFGHFGDCLYATTLAQQIKNDNPGCHLTWAIAPKFQSILIMNPHVDSILTVPYMYSDIPFDTAWDKFHKEIKDKFMYEYDTIIVSQLARDNLRYYDGSIRSAILRTYQKKISVPLTPIVVLTDDEILNVNSFLKNNHIKSFSNVVLFECSPQSCQSSMNIEFAMEVSRLLVKKFNNTCFLLSSSIKLNSSTPQIIDASQLSFRENAELANHCTLLVGCSSGITWLSTSTWTKKINTIQIINSGYAFSASVAYDAKRFGLPVDHILEIEDGQKESLACIIEQALTDGFETVRKKWHCNIDPNVKCLAKILSEIYINNGCKELFSAYLMMTVNNNIYKSRLLCHAVTHIVCRFLFIVVEFIFPVGTNRRKRLRNIKKIFPLHR